MWNVGVQQYKEVQSSYPKYNTAARTRTAAEIVWYENFSHDFESSITARMPARDVGEVLHTVRFGALSNVSAAMVRVLGAVASGAGRCSI